MMRDHELLEKCAISLQEAVACIQLLIFSDSDIEQIKFTINDCFHDIMGRLESDE